jgi:methylmalonyl-CoA/ethylmalonyl-CoA epimerase
VQEELKQVPGIKFVDHVAIAVKAGELEGQVKAYEMLGFREIHREEVRGGDQVREALLQIGEGPNLIQLLEPLTPESPVAEADRQKRRARRAGARGVSRGERTAGVRGDEGERIPADRQGSARGSRGTTVFFVHPKSRADFAFGFLIEMVEDPRQMKNDGY